MGFFNNLIGRSSRVVKGQANKTMDKIEDATFDATLREAVRELKGELNKAVGASAEAMSNHNRLEAEYQKHQRQSEQWKERAKTALESGNEDLAKKALAKRAEAEQQVSSMQTSVDQARATSSKLKEQMGDLRRKIQEAERNASTLIARKNAAKAQKKVAQAMAGISESDNAFAAIKGFEETVAREEAQAQAFETMGDVGTDTDKELEEEFAKLETSTVDTELDALKKEMGK